MDLPNLRAFYFVGKHGSLRLAAAYLKLSSPAISVQLKKLERNLGVKLWRASSQQADLDQKEEKYYLTRQLASLTPLDCGKLRPKAQICIPAN